MPDLMKYFPRSVLLFALIVATITSLPYLTGLLDTPVGWQYSGMPASPTGIQFDYASHFAKMWQGSRGQWDYHLLFTHETHPGLLLVQGFYVALGALAHITVLGIPVVFHIARSLLTFGMILAIWVFSCRFFEKPKERWLGLLFGTVSVGWSWWLLFVSPDTTQSVAPIEFWLTDAFNTLGAFYMPHFAAAVILQIVIVLSFDDWVRQTGKWRLVTLTLALAAEAIVQPYSILLLLPLLFVLTIYHTFSIKRLSIRRAFWLLIPVVIHSALVLYQYVVLNTDPVWASFTVQNQTLSPDLIYYLLGYLPFIIPMAIGLRVFLLDRADDRWWLPILWVALVAMLLYAPFPTQRRYLLGVQTPLAVMSAYGWSRAVLTRFRERRRTLISILYLALTSVALIGVIAANGVALSNPRQSTNVFYQPDELAAYDWLRHQNQPEDLVVTTFSTNGTGNGSRIVAATGQRVFLGHWIETADFEHKMDLIRQFYSSSTPDSWRMSFLKDINATYIWYDESAKQLGEWNPSQFAFAEAVFASDTITIYKVIRGS
ncbi:MAG: hypothetical protein R3E39_05365 [Anaerolineae bacterium]